MTVKSAPYYWAECDECGKRCEYGDFSALADEQHVTSHNTRRTLRRNTGTHAARTPYARAHARMRARESTTSAHTPHGRAVADEQHLAAKVDNRSAQGLTHGHHVRVVIPPIPPAHFLPTVLSLHLQDLAAGRLLGRGLRGS